MYLSCFSIFFKAHFCSILFVNALLFHGQSRRKFENNIKTALKLMGSERVMLCVEYSFYLDHQMSLKNYLGIAAKTLISQLHSAAMSAGQESLSALPSASGSQGQHCKRQAKLGGVLLLGL